MRHEDIEKKAASRSMNKWISVFEEEFDIDPEGERPTERMRSVIEQLQLRLEELHSAEEFDNFMKKTVTKWYRIGARRGAAEAIKKLHEMAIISDDDYESLPETLEWKKKLRYTGFDGKNKNIRRRRYSIDL